MVKSKIPAKGTWSNPELAKAMQEKRRSSAAQRHTVKARKGSRAQRQHRAIQDQKPGSE